MKKFQLRIFPHPLLFSAVVGAMGLARPLFATESTVKAEFVGAEACAACHGDQVEAFKGVAHGKALPKSKDIAFDKSCETCHGPGSLHVEAAGDKTNPGFSTVKDFKKMSTARVADACKTCHRDAQLTHWLGSAHERARVSCTDCHRLHGAQGPSELALKTQSETCYRCHKNVRAEMRRSAHMPVEEGKMNCTSCHGPHGTESQKLLLASNTNQLCFQCHQDKRGPHLWEHAPVRENCLSCHHPHGSHHEKMLLAKRSFLCQRCHTGGGHPSTAYDAGNITQISNKIAGQTCQECHPTIHGSNHPSGKMFTR